MNEIWNILEVIFYAFVGLVELCRRGFSHSPYESIQKEQEENEIDMAYFKKKYMASEELEKEVLKLKFAWRFGKNYGEPDMLAGQMALKMRDELYQIAKESGLYEHDYHKAIFTPTPEMVRLGIIAQHGKVPSWLLGDNGIGLRIQHNDELVFAKWYDKELVAHGVPEMIVIDWDYQRSQISPTRESVKRFEKLKDVKSVDKLKPSDVSVAWPDTRIKGGICWNEFDFNVGWRDNYWDVVRTIKYYEDNRN